MESRQNQRLRAAVIVIAVITGALVLLGFVFDMPAALGGSFFSDCATYYGLAGSIAYDFDLEYQRADLQRIYADFSGGPSGIFLQRNPDNQRLYYGKAYIYPIFLAPAVRLFGPRGVLITHALLLGIVLLGMTLLWEQRWGAVWALGAGLAFVLPTVATAYYFWIAPEFFNFALIFAACFFWLYKEINPRDEGETPPRWRAALLGGWTDMAAAALFGVATYSKLSNGVLALPLLAFLILRRRWLRFVVVALVFAAATLALFGIQWAATGNWNYQGGERKSFQLEFPYANSKTFDDASASTQETNIGEYRPPFYLVDIAHNVVYFFFGRFGGVVPYYFPAALALGLFLAFGRRGLFRWLLLMGAALAALTYIILIPTNVIGGGGTVGNRYFMNIFPLILFLIPAGIPRWAPVAAVAGGVLFAGHIVINPLYTSAQPARYSETPVLRILPVEFTMLNDLPINTEADRRRVPWYRVRNGEVVLDEQGRQIVDFFVYHLDHNSFLKEVSPANTQRIWAKGGTMAELVLRSVEPIKKLRVSLMNSAVRNTVTISVQGQSITQSMKPGQKLTLDFTPGPSFAYHNVSTSYLCTVAVSTSNGVSPRTREGGSNDWRFLGVALEFIVLE